MNESRHDDRLTQWIRQHGRMVLGYLDASLRDRALAEDLMQEVFCRAWEARESYVENGRDRAYLLRIAHRLLMDHWRRQPGERAGLDMASPVVTEAEAFASLRQREARAQLEAALESLTPPQRQTLLLRYFGDLSFREIADELKLPISTVLSHCRRGLLAMRRLLVEEPT